MSTTRDVADRELDWPCPRWALRKAPKAGAGAVDPRMLGRLLDETFGPEHWELRIVRRPRTDTNEIVIPPGGKENTAKRVVVASCVVEIKARTRRGTLRREGAGIFTAQWSAHQGNAMAAGAIELALKSCATIGFKRAAARLGRRFGADTASREKNYATLCDEAKEESHRAMKTADAWIAHWLTPVEQDRGGIAKAIEHARQAHRIDPWTSEDWYKTARTAITHAQQTP